MGKAVSSLKGEILAEKMKNLRVGQEDLIAMDGVKLEI